MKKINSALISVFNKVGLEPLIETLTANGVKLYSTGGTQKFIENLGKEVTSVESETDYPSIFGGRVKTLHPAIFGGILYRRSLNSDQAEKEQHNIPDIDLVIVDLYPFEDTVASGASHEDIIEKIDIGGISLIRAAAKNYQDVMIISSRDQYEHANSILKSQSCSTELEQRKNFAMLAFNESSHYDSMIHGYFAADSTDAFKSSYKSGQVLRYGENPHQKGIFYGDISEVFEKLGGKEVSYNNLVDVEAAVALTEEWEDDTVFIIVKHTNACGVSSGSSVLEAYEKALAADPVSAFGGILSTNSTVDLATAEKINELFYEVLIAPDFAPEALKLLQSKKKRILFRKKKPVRSEAQYKSLLNGVLWQEADNETDQKEELKTVTKESPNQKQIEDLIFASKVAKHTKSNTIVLVKDGQMLSSGVGQTSRVDALKQSIEKAKSFGFDLKGAVMASDAFFPFPDCVEIADKAGISSVIQPGGSVKDQDSIDYCDKHGLSMVITGRRHFKH